MKIRKPASFAEFIALKEASLAYYQYCIECEAPFTCSNVHSSEGWKKTQITGLCEDCFDNMFADQLAQEAATDMQIKDHKEGF